MTTAAEVMAAWAAIAELQDATESFDQANALLRDPEEHDALVAHAIDHMNMVDASVGGLLDAMDYGFCRDRRLWRRGNEAVLQARALQQILVWSERSEADRPLLQRVVVRHTFETNLEYPTPRLLMSRGIRFLVVPFVYQEILLLSAAVLADASGSTWDFLQTPATDATWGGEAPLAFRKLVARLLTNDAFDVHSDEENPVAKLSRHAGWFSGIDGEHEPSDVETVLAYSGQDYAMAHEMGHCATEGDHADEVDTEMAADAAGYRLYAASWGWRDEVLDGCPLQSGARILLGPIWFFFTASLLFTVRQALLTRLDEGTSARDTLASTEKDLEHLSVLDARWSVLHTQLDEHVRIVRQLGGPIGDADLTGIANFVHALDLYAQAVPRWVSSIPVEDLDFAMRVAGTGAING